MATYTSEVSAWYEDVQFRAPPAADLAAYVAGLNSGTLTPIEVQTAIINDPYTVEFVNPVIREYQAAFDRVPDQAGLAYWVNVVATDPNGLAQLNTIFANSAEFTGLYGATANTPASIGLVNSLYENVLGRAPDPAGLAYWTSQGLTASQLLQAFAQSQEFIQDTTAAVASFEQLELTGAEPMTGSLYQLGGPPTTFFNLTPGADTVNGITNVTGDLSPYFFNGIGPTLNSNDSITNVTNLTITDQYGTGNDIIPAGAHLANITNIILDTAGNAGASGLFDTSGISGVQTLTVNSAGTEWDNVNAGSTTAITINHSGHEGGVDVTGGSTVTVTTNGADSDVWVGSQEGGVDPANTAGLPTGAVVVNENGSGEASVHVLGGTSVTVNVNSPSNTGNIDIGNTFDNTGDFSGAVAGATNPTGAIVVNDAAQYGGDISSANYDVITVFGGTTVNVTAAGDEVVVGDAFVVNPSNQPTGDVTIVNTSVNTLSDATLGAGTGQYEDVYVNGGANVSVTTNTGDVFVGDTEWNLNAAGTGALAGTQPTGAVTIVDTASEDGVEIGVYGGTSVTINNAATVSAADIQVGAVVDGAAGPVVLAPTGDVTIFDDAAKAWAGSSYFDGSWEHVGSTGIGHEIDVLGGANISITTNTASVVVGGDDLNTAGTAVLAGENPTGSVTIVDNATSDHNDAGGTALNAGGIWDATVTVFGGTNVNVTAAGIDVTIGADTGDGFVVAPSGAVTVVDTATEWGAYDNVLSTYDEAVDVIGGTSVNVTTNSGSVWIGENGATPTAGSEPTGAITVVDNSVGNVDVYGGTDVNVTSAGGWVQVGDGANSANSALTNPTGNVMVTMAAVETGWDYGTNVKVEGGINVTVNTTGGDVMVGTNYVGDGNTPVTGAVVVNNTYGGITKDSVHVMGGTTVNITTSATRGGGTITVGNDPFAPSPVLQNAAGTALLTTGDGSSADAPTGDVTIFDATVVSPTNTIYGTEAFSVLMNGGTTATITGGNGNQPSGPNIVGDVQSELLTATGLAAGTSHLSTVNFTGVIGETIIGSDALKTVSVSDTGTGNTFDGIIFNDTANSSLTLNLANATAGILDGSGQPGFAGPAAFIGSIVVNTTGTEASTLGLLADQATSLTFNDTADLTLAPSDLTAVTSITVTGAGDLNLGDWSASTKLLTINASTASGGVDVAINPELTSFAGGSGDDVVSITAPGEDFGTLLTSGSVTINGGGGTNTIYNLYDGAAGDLALGNIGFGAFQNFQNFGVAGDAGAATGEYNVEGFSGLVVGGLDVPGEATGLTGVAGDITFFNVAQGASLDIIDNNNFAINYELQTAFSLAKPGSVSITVGLDGSTTDVFATVDLSQGGTVESNIGSVTVDSQGKAGSLNFLTLASDGAALTLPLTNITITGDASLVLVADGNGEAVTTIDASASSGAIVDVDGVALASTGVTVTGGSGLILADGYAATAITTSVDAFNVGSGGGAIGVGAGGAGFDSGLGTSIGSETINLAKNAPTGTWVLSSANVGGTGEGSFAVVNNWTHGTAGSGQSADALAMAGTPVVIANASNVHEGSAIYNVSDGVISLAAGSPTASGAQQLQAAQTIVDAAATGTIAAITVPITATASGATSATFVIENEGGGTADIFVELVGGLGGNTLGFGGVPGLAGLPSASDIGAGASVTLLTADYGAVFANLTDITDLGSATANVTYTTANDTVDGAPGLATIDNLTTTAAGFTTTYDNLGNFGILQANTVGDGNVVVTQIGVDPVLTLTATGDVTLNHLTYGNSAVASDDPTLVLYAAGGNIDINTLIDASNTGTTVLIAGGHDVTIGGITDASLTTIDASDLGGHLDLTAAGKGLTITGATAAGDSITANGAGDMISVGSDTGVANTSNDVSITANGAGDHISVVGGEWVYIGAAGAGDTITVADSSENAYLTGNGNTAASPNSGATQLGANDTINVGDTEFSANAHMWLGANSTVNLVNSSSANIHLQGDTAGASLTNMTTINGVGVDGNNLYLHFNDTNASISNEAWAGGAVWHSQVNEASATSLASALNIAASQALTMDQTIGSGGNTTVVGQNTTTAAVQLNAHTGLLDWFQYSGNTYIVEATNSTATAATHAGLAAGDTVVELTGIVDVSHSVGFHLA